MDSIHKVVSPETYDCNLCAITYGAFSEDKLWKAFRQGSSHEMTFLHRDEFQKKFADVNEEFPAVYSEENGSLNRFISKGELDALTSAEDLIEEIMRRSARD